MTNKPNKWGIASTNMSVHKFLKFEMHAPPGGNCTRQWAEHFIFYFNILELIFDQAALFFLWKAARHIIL